MNNAFENNTFLKAATEAARSHARDTGCTIVEALEYVASNPVNFSLPIPSGVASGVTGDEYEYTKRPDGSVWKRQHGDVGWTRVKRPRTAR